MDNSGYYLRQRPLSVAVSTENLTSSTTYSLATIAHSTGGTPGYSSNPTHYIICDSDDITFGCVLWN